MQETAAEDMTSIRNRHDFFGSHFSKDVRQSFLWEKLFYGVL